MAETHDHSAGLSVKVKGNASLFEMMELRRQSSGRLSQGPCDMDPSDASSLRPFAEVSISVSASQRMQGHQESSVMAC